jgi:hypothetical protein
MTCLLLSRRFSFDPIPFKRSLRTPELLSLVDAADFTSHSVNCIEDVELCLFRRLWAES